MLSAISQSDPRGTEVPLEINFIISTRELDVTLFLLFPVRWVMERLRQLRISSLIYFRMQWRYQQVPALSVLFIPVGIPGTFFEERKDLVAPSP